MRALFMTVLAVSVLASGCASIAHSDSTTPSITDGLIVSGALPRTATLSRAELEALGAIEGHWTQHGTDHPFRGVSLDAVLTHMGFTRGEMGSSAPKADKAAGWKKVVLVTAADGFQAVFSCAELMPSMGSTKAFIVWEMDGAPVPAEQGPLRLIVTTDQEGSRSPWSVRSIEVIDVRDQTRRRR